jgi:hypothetical protein
VVLLVTVIKQLSWIIKAALFFKNSSISTSDFGLLLRRVSDFPNLNFSETNMSKIGDGCVGEMANVLFVGISGLYFAI